MLISSGRLSGFQIFKEFMTNYVEYEVMGRGGVKEEEEDALPNKFPMCVCQHIV